MTTQTKHTPGPWTAGISESGNNIIVAGQTLIAESRKPRKGFPSSVLEHNANAALIAQAPDLLRQRDKLREALKDLEAIASLVSGLVTLHGNASPEKWYSLAMNTEHARAILAETEEKL